MAVRVSIHASLSTGLAAESFPTWTFNPESSVESPVPPPMDTILNPETSLFIIGTG
jgi:hypothetical protein